MMTGSFQNWRGVSNAGFRPRFRPERTTPDVSHAAPGTTAEDAVSRIRDRRGTNATRRFANLLEAIGGAGLLSTLYFFFRDKPLALRVLIGSGLIAGVGVLLNLGLTLVSKLRRRGDSC